MALHCRSGLAAGRPAGLSSCSGLFRLPAIQFDLHRREAPFIIRRRSAGSDHEKKQFPKVIRASVAIAAPCTSQPAATKSAMTTVRDYYRSGILDIPEHYVDNVGLEEDEEEEVFLQAQLHLLVNAASDRAQMHTILAQQRDNWNKLFQNTLTLATFTACLLSALSTRMPSVSGSFSLSIPALLLNTGCAAVMSVVNYFQPSQLAEEQRNAVRQFKRLANDVESALQVAPQLRQRTIALLRDSQRRLQALDAAFPMPLTPGGLEKFPSKVTPPALLTVEPYSNNSERVSGGLLSHDINGWDERKCRDLQQLAEQVRHSDINMYVSWSENVIKVNKCLAIAAPLLAASAATLNGFALLLSGATWPGTLAAVCTLMAAFTGSVSHDLQLGTVFEMYRNAAGHYGEVEESVLKTLHQQPIEERENGVLFLHRVAYKLGRWTGDLK